MKNQQKNVLVIASLSFIAITANPQTISVGVIGGTAVVRATRAAAFTGVAAIKSNPAIGVMNTQMSTIAGRELSSVEKIGPTNSVVQQNLAATSATLSSKYAIQPLENFSSDFTVNNFNFLPMNVAPVNNNGFSQDEGVNRGELPAEPTTESMNSEVQSYTDGFAPQNSTQHAQLPAETSSSVPKSQSASPIIGASEVDDGLSNVSDQ